MSEKQAVRKPLVIIPTYNERENIQALIHEILRQDATLHVLVVDDASPDDTATAAESLPEPERRQVTVLRRSGKLGLGSAYVCGFQWGLRNGHDFMIQMDADWSHNPHYLPTMLRAAANSDFVIGSRYVPGGGTRNWGRRRQLISRFGSFYSRVILGVNIADFTGGFNGWRAQVLRRVDPGALRSNGYSFQVELKYRACRAGFLHCEFPIVFDERRDGKSKMSLKIAVEAIWRVWAFRFRI